MEIKKSNLILIALIVTSAFHLVLTILPENVSGATLFVGGIGPGNYTKIQDAIEAATPGDTVYVFNGTYYENLIVSKPLSLLGEDTDTTIIDGGATGNVVDVIADWVNISGFTATNSGSSGNDAGIELNSVQNCSIGGISASNNDYGIYLYYSNGNVISESSASNNDVGILLVSSDDNHLVASKFILNDFGGIYLFNSSRNSVVNSIASWNNFEGIQITFSSSNFIGNNTALDNGQGIALYSSTNHILSNNTMVDNGVSLGGDSLEHWNTHGIDTSNTVNGKPVHYWKDVTGGTIPSGAGQVILANCTGVFVGNQDINNTSYGITLGFSSNNTIANNTASSNHRLGIVLGHSHHNRISNNSVFDNLTGINVRFSNGTTIVNNTASHNSYGIGLYDCRNITVLSNTLSDNENGFSIIYSNNNTIADNAVYSSTLVSIFMRFSDNNSIYHNNFVDNARPPFDDSGTNRWDNGYPSGGNYWNDYIGTDNKSGPNQDQPGNDGIGDIPYVIDADSQDLYPLMFPIGIKHPRPPALQQTNLSGDSLENVTLTWSLSPDDGRGFKSAIGYEIYRNMTYDPNGLGYVLIASLPNGTSEFDDNLVGEGDPNSYFYQVCALDLNNNTTCAKNQAAKFTRPLSSGPNLVSIPLVQSDKSIETVLQTVSFDKAWFYDSFDKEWKSYMKSKPYFGDVGYVDYVVGFWVDVAEYSNLTIAGVVPLIATISLKAGWNLIPFSSFQEDYTVADLKAAATVQRIEGFDGSNPPYFLRVLQDFDILLAGHAYWMNVSSDTSWTVRNT